MGLELLAGPFDVFPVVDRVLVTTGVADARPPGIDIAGQCMLIEGRGVLTHAGNLRFVVQPDGAYAQLGSGRFNRPTMASARVLAWVEGGQRSYAEYETTSTGDYFSTGRVHELHPVTLTGWRDLGPVPAFAPHAAAYLPGGIWISTSFDVLRLRRYNGTAWDVEADLPLASAHFLSWAESPDEIWLGNLLGEVCRYNWRTRAVVVGSLRRTGVACMGIWYWRKHGVFVSLHNESGVRRTRVWASTPLPTKLEQTVLPAPTAGRVSRVRSRLLGSHDEPCAGEVVTWEVPAGYQLVPLSPVTDSDGYALADVVVPMGATGTGAIVARVEV